MSVLPPAVAPPLALVSSVSWGAADFIAGAASRRVGSTLMTVWSQGISGAFVWLVIAFGWVGGAPSLSQLVWAMAGGAVGGLGVVSLYRALSMGAMSLVTPITACSVVVPVVVSLVLGQTPDSIVMAGVVLTVVGGIGISLPPADARHVRMNTQSFILALVAAIGFAGFFVCLDQAAGSTIKHAVWAAGGARVGSLVVLVPLALALRAPLRAPRQDWQAIAAVGGCDLAANMMYAVAATAGSLAVVAALGALYPVTTIVLAWALLDERLTRRQIVSIAVALLGVMMITANAA